MLQRDIRLVNAFKSLPLEEQSLFCVLKDMAECHIYKRRKYVRSKIPYGVKLRVAKWLKGIE